MRQPGRETQTKGSMWSLRQRLEGCSHKPVNTWSHQKLGEARKDAPPELVEGAPHDFGPLGSRSVKEYISVFLRPYMCGDMLEQPSETNANVKPRKTM